MAEAGGATVGEVEAGAAGAVAVIGAAWVASGAAAGAVCGVDGDGELVIGEAAAGLTAVPVSAAEPLMLPAASSAERAEARAVSAREAWTGALWTSVGAVAGAMVEAEPLDEPVMGEAGAALATGAGAGVAGALAAGAGVAEWGFILVAIRATEPPTSNTAKAAPIIILVRELRARPRSCSLR